MAAATHDLRAPVPAVAAGLAVIYVVWGSTYLGIKLAGETIPPMLMTSARCLIAGAILYAWFIRRGDVEGDRPTVRTWIDAGIVGSLLLCGGLGLVALAEQRVPSGIAAVLIAAAPLWMTLFDRVLHGVRLTRTILAGLLIGFGGVALFVSPWSGGDFDAKGIAMLIVSPIFWSAGTVYAKRAQLPSRPFVATSLEFIVGGVAAAIVGLALGQGSDLELDQISQRSLIGFVYLVVIGSIFAFTAYVWLLQVAPISLVSTYAYVNPVVALALGALIDGESVGAGTIAAGAVILVGVALIVSGHALRTASPEPPA